MYEYRSYNRICGSDSVSPRVCTASSEELENSQSRGHLDINGVANPFQPIELADIRLPGPRPSTYIDEYRLSEHPLPTTNGQAKIWRERIWKKMGLATQVHPSFKTDRKKYSEQW